MTKSTHFLVSHIYKEMNSCADKMAYFGFANKNFTCFDNVNDSIMVDFFKNKQALALNISLYRGSGLRLVRICF